MIIRPRPKRFKSFRSNVCTWFLELFLFIPIITSRVFLQQQVCTSSWSNRCAGGGAANAAVNCCPANFGGPLALHWPAPVTDLVGRVCVKGDLMPFHESLCSIRCTIASWTHYQIRASVQCFEPNLNICEIGKSLFRLMGRTVTRDSDKSDVYENRRILWLGARSV